MIRLLAIALFLFSAITAAQAEKRVALVIGNSAYANVAKLPNPADHPAFLKVVKAVPKPSRDAWKAIVRASSGDDPPGELGLLLRVTRNRLSYHYDRKLIGQAFRARFCGPEATSDGPPYISRGTTLDETRFYFVDAALEKAVLLQAGISEVGPVGARRWAEKILPAEVMLGSRVASALYHIVTCFPATRGASWQPPPRD